MSNIQSPLNENKNENTKTRKSYLLKIVGILAFIPGIVCFALIQTPIIRGLIPTIILSLIGTASMYIGVYCFQTGRKIKVVSADEVLNSDNRPPVVYLRSFNDDIKTSQIPNFVRNLPLTMATEEEDITSVLNKIGPCVAIGRPGEKLPELGAVRMYVSNDEWKQKVEELTNKSSLVVLRSGDTDGFWWEVQHSIQTISPDRIIFIVPGDQKAADKFRERLNQYLKIPLLELRLPKRRFYTMGGIVYLKEDLTPVFLPLKYPGAIRASLRRPVTSYFYCTLEPLFKQLGIAYSPLPVNWMMVVILIVLGSSIPLTIGVVIWAFLTLS